MRTFIYKSSSVSGSTFAVKTFFVCLLFAMVGSNATAQVTDTKAETAQEHTINGFVKSGDDNEPLVGVNIYIKDSAEGTTTDENGQFIFPRKVKTGEILVFSFVGLERQQYVVTQQVPALLEITMVMDPEVMLGELAMTGKCGNAQQSGLRRFFARITGRI